jgi:hypothetical protein
MNSNRVPKQLTSICTLYLIDLEVLAQMFKKLSDYLYPLSFSFSVQSYIVQLSL